ncbi:MAG TPA: HD domain-containing phosphohydrolase [Thermoanaerobaculia bacterium]|nr:HD domain-containing phosphohydrolase [Thermoanaerobaculia bacterium]
MQAEVEELRPRLKEILYDCAVDVRATKAALYLLEPSVTRFELVTEYGFRGLGLRESVDQNDPIADRCGRGRTPFFVNGLAAEPRFSQLMFEAGSDRLLAAPMYSRGKLVGFVDMRDKAGKLPFENEDLPKAQRIAERLVELFVDMNVFGHRFISLSTSETPAARVQEPEAPTAPHPAMPAAAPAPPPVPAPPAKPETRAHVPRLATLVIDARSAASRILTAQPESITDAEVAAVRDVLRAILLIPGVVAATFSAFGHLGGVQEVAARSTMTEEAKNVLQSKLNVWLTKRGEGGGFLRPSSVTTPLGTAAPPVTPAEIQKVFTAPLSVGGLRGLYLTVAFSENPERIAHELLAVLHTHLQLVIEQSMQRGTAATTRARIAEKLIEPDFARYPELRRHTEIVASLCEAFARHLRWPAHEVENARIVGLVHDCGMRLLDYERLYRKRDLTSEEMGFLREHPHVGAALVEPLLGAEVARAVLCHHERVDGSGYPNELHGDEIPLLSRALQICDAWAAMTDFESYRPPEPPASALGALGGASGAQFDAELTSRFIEMIRAGRGPAPV